MNLRGGYEMYPVAVVATGVRWSSKVAEMRDMLGPEQEKKNQKKISSGFFFRARATWGPSDFGRFWAKSLL